MVTHPPSSPLPIRWRSKTAFLRHNNDGDALSPPQRLRALEDERLPLVTHETDVLLFGAEPARKALRLRNRHAVWELNRHAHGVDGENPFGSGGVPIQFVMRFEEAQLPIGSVVDLPQIIPPIEHDFRVTQPNTNKLLTA